MAAGSSRNGSLVDWIQETIGRYPDSVAAVDANGTLSFRELGERSTSLARKLVERGVGRNSLVGLWSDQSTDLLVGILGILAAGAAYVPLDPSYPRSRLDYIAKESKFGVVVAPNRLVEEARNLDLPVIPIRTVESEQQDTSTPLPQVRSDDAAYVIFTSGSTGRPKGVIVEHHSVMKLLEWMLDVTKLVTGDRIAGTASPNFDGSVPNFFLPMVIGGTFVALPKSAASDPHVLVSSIQRHRPRALQTSPTMLRLLTESNWSGDANVSLLIGGDRISAAAIRYIAPRVRDLFNFYGPTEATVNVTVAKLQPDDVDSPIGRPAGFAQCWILDAMGEFVVDQQSGELVITGEALARGYLNEPSMTAERFPQLTLPDGMKVRSYRTGDVAKWRSDGSLMLLGRLDDQINLRGFRVEPAEIERTLMQFPSVEEAVVVSHQIDPDDDPRIIAYIKSTSDVESTDLRSFAKELLPAHMVPSIFVEIDEFPVTPNGKLDRRSLSTRDLPAHRYDATNDGGVTELPANDLERSVAEIFANVLETSADSIGVNEDFFDIGGTSIRCVRLFMMVEEKFGVTLPISTLVAAPTIRLLSSSIQAETQTTGEPYEVVEATQTTWEKIVCNLWSEILGVINVQSSDNFFDLGGTDQQAQVMIDQLKEIGAADLSLERFRSINTVAQLAAMTSKRFNQSCLIGLRVASSKTALFCITGAGGLALAFLPLVRQLKSEQTVYGLQARGLESRGIPDLTLARCAKRYVREIRKVQPHGPYTIAGHSLGGAIAMKMVQQLEDEGEQVALLAIFDTRLTSRMIGMKNSEHLHNEGTRNAWHLYSVRPSLSTILRLPLAGMIRQRGTMQYDLFYWIGAIQARMSRSLGTWSGRTVIFGSDNEDSEDIKASWSRLLTGNWKYLAVPGSHQNMIRFPHVVFLAENLEREIAQSLSVIEEPSSSD